MAGYTRQSAANIVNGAVVNASDHNAEYNAIEAAFNASTGHTHDGTTGGGAPVAKWALGTSSLTSPAGYIAGDTNTGVGQVGGADTISLIAGGVESLRATAIASAVNFVRVYGATTNNAPTITVDGADSGISMAYSTKGAGSHIFYTNSGTIQFALTHTASASNFVTLTGGATGVYPTFAASGSDTNVGFNFNAKGIGGYAFNASGTQFSIAPTASSTNYLTVTGSNGGAPSLSAAGGSTNIDMQYAAKGTGNHYFACNGANQAIIGGPSGSNRQIAMYGSNGGNPYITTTAGNLNLTSAGGSVLVNGSPISGIASFPVSAKSSAYTVTTSDAAKTISCTGTFQVSLPAAATAGSGFTLIVYNNGSGIITVKPNGAETIGGTGAVAVASGSGILIVSDGTSTWAMVGSVSSVTALDPSNKGASMTLSGNNLTAVNSTGTWSCARATSAITAGKWYFEGRQDITDASPAKTMFGVAASTVSMADGNHIGTANCWSLTDAGNLAVNGSNTASWSSTWGSAGSVIGMYIDATNLASIKIWFALNGVLIASGDPATGANPAATITGSPTLYPAIALINSQQASMRFSKQSWAYTPVTGYNALP